VKTIIYYTTLLGIGSSDKEIRLRRTSREDGRALIAAMDLIIVLGPLLNRRSSEVHARLLS